MTFAHRNRADALKARLIATLAVGAALLWLGGCNSTQQPSDEQVKQQAAQTTQQVKQGAQQAAADAKVAAANAEEKVNAIAAGVKQGLKSDGKPGAAVVDINSASEDQLVDLPGISGERARRIVHGRPYGRPQDLVSKGILTRDQYARISGQITAN